MELVACGITALAYLGTLAFGFVYDDVLQVFQSPALHEWRYFPQYFTSHVLAAIYPGAGGNYYRPLLMVWLRLNYVLFGPEPAGWHATTVLCHVLATYLVFRVGQQATRSGELDPQGLKPAFFVDPSGTAEAVPFPKPSFPKPSFPNPDCETSNRMVAFCAALLFGLHPSHIESVAWISGVSDPLMACFFLGSLSMFFEGRGSARISHIIYSLVLFGCALLSKETAVVLPALIFVAALMGQQGAGESQPTGRRIWLAIRTSIPYGLVAVLYLGVRFRALHGFSHPAISLSWKQVLLTWPAVLWFYARHLLLPIGLSEFYTLNYVDHATARGFWLPLAMVAVVFLVSWFWIRALKLWGAAWLAAVLIVLPLLPVLDLRSLTVGDVVHDRYLYLPSIGFVLLVALSLRELARRMPSFHAVRLPLAATGLIALVFAALTVTQQTQWRNDIQLYTRGLESAPNNLTVRDNLANALLAANQPERAIPMYLEVLKRNPGFWRSNYNLGFAYYKLGNPAAAEAYFQRAIQIDPTDSDEFIYLALAQWQRKKFSQAEENARQAIARNPRARGYHLVLGLIEEALGDRNAAMAALRTEVTEHPDNAAAAAELTKIEGVPTTPQP
jgi:Tfp pilus assembly protein PilF